MARQRTIAPGYFRNEELGSCSPLARLFFSGLWCWADRRGRIEDRPRRLRAEILPYDEHADGEALVAELTAHGFLKRYEANGVKVIQILNFEKYQTPHPRETESTLPDEAGNLPGKTEGSPKADLGSTHGEPEGDAGSAKEAPRSPSSLASSSPASSSLTSHSPGSLASLASGAGGRAKGGAGVQLGPLGAEVVAEVSAGVGVALAPLTRQADAAEFERRIAAFSRGTPEALEFFARTIRNRKSKPEGVKVLLLMLRDLEPIAKVGGAA